MVDPQAFTTESWSSALEDMTQDIRVNTLGAVSVGVEFLALILLGGLPNMMDVIPVAAIIAALMAIGGLTWTIRTKHPSPSSWLVILGTTILCILLVTLGGVTTAVVLLAVPVGLSALLLTRKTGALVGTGLTLALLFLPSLAMVDLPSRLMAIILLWFAWGLVWLVLRPMHTTVRWAWYGYQNIQSILDQSRDHQQQWMQTLDQLTEANGQLARLNHLAQSLRLVAESERHAKERFVANVSHELRTPLNMIIGFCEMITQSPRTYGQDLPPVLLADLAVVLRNSQHLSSLIDDVLDLSQVDAGRMEITREPTALDDIIQSVVTAVRPLYLSKNLALTVELPEPLPLLYCDRTRMRQVLLNLLSNAGRFTDAGGVVVRATLEDTDIAIRVTDTGIGLTPEAQKKLFEPFQQINSTIKRDYGGSGLGLSISKSFVELHGGTIHVESEHGRGTTFVVRLPLGPTTQTAGGVLRWFSPYENHEEHLGRQGYSPQRPTSRVVVVDRGQRLRRRFHRAWGRSELRTVENLASAAATIERLPANLVLVNEPLPSSWAKAQEDLPHPVPIIWVDGTDETLDASTLEVSDYLLKPVSRRRLLASLDALDRPIRTVLIVDDQPDALQLFGRMLSTAGRGYRVLRAMDGQQALGVMLSEHPDVVLLDLAMPVLDGYKTLDAIKVEPALHDTPVILLSAKDPERFSSPSRFLAVTVKQGFTQGALVECVQAVTAVLARHGLCVDPTPPETPGD